MPNRHTKEGVKKEISVIIADDHEIVRTGLANVLAYEDGLAVTGLAKNGQLAVELVKKVKPDVVIMDLFMPVMDGIEATRTIHEVCPSTRVLVLTSYGTSEELHRAQKAGAAGLIMKSASNSEIIQALRRVAAGETYISPEIEQMIVPDESSPELTERQIEILRSITRGLTNQDIATQFGITLGGVKKHMTTIFNKLGVANRSEAISTALRKQLLKI